MKISDFTIEDARKCADLIALLTSTNKLIDSLKLAGIQVQGSSAANKEAVLAWVKEFATQMANEISSKEKELGRPSQPPKQAPASKPVKESTPVKKSKPAKSKSK
jgi:hypothetical protein